MIKRGRVKFICFKKLPNNVTEKFTVITDLANAEKAMNEYRNRDYIIHLKTS